MTCRHGKPSFTCAACGYFQLLLGQLKREVTRLPKDINKLIFAMIPKPKLILFQLDLEHGLLRYQHVCDGYCYMHGKPDTMRTLEVAFYGTEEEARGFAYGLIFRFNAEGEYWYHRNHVVQGEYDDFKLTIMDPDHERVTCRPLDWSFNSSRPEEFLSGFALAIEVNVTELPQRADQIVRNLHALNATRDDMYYEIIPRGGSEFICPSCCSKDGEWSGEECACGGSFERADYIYPAKINCEVICKVSPYAPPPAELVVVIDEICTAILKNGQRCKYRGKFDGRCGIHK